MRIMLRKSVADEICRYWGFPLVKSVKTRRQEFLEIKRELLAHIRKLRKQEEAEVKKASWELEKSFVLEKAASKKPREKAENGAIRTWSNGKKYKRIAPGKWVQVCNDDRTRGAKQSLRYIERKIASINDERELMWFVQQNKEKFVDDWGYPLPAVERLSELAHTRNDEIVAGIIDKPQAQNKKTVFWKRKKSKPVVGQRAPSNKENAENKEFYNIDNYKFAQGLKPEHRKIFEAEFKKIPLKQAKFLYKYARDMNVKMYEYFPNEKGAVYNVTTNTVYMDGELLNYKQDFSSDVFSRGFRTFLHETGHWLNHNVFANETIHSRLGKGFVKRMKQDVLDRCNSVNSEQYKIHNLSQLKNCIEKQGVHFYRGCNCPYEFSSRLGFNGDVSSRFINGVVDLYGGATKNVLKQDWSWHSTNYWNTDTLADEAMAHFFEARCWGDEKTDCVRKFFPLAYGYFENYISNNFS